MRAAGLIILLVIAACTGPPSDSSTASTTGPAPTTSTTTPLATSTTTVTEEGPDLILHSGQVLTMDEQFTITEAVVVDDGLITMTGATEDALKLAGTSTTVLDLGGRTVMPGFVDPHTHLLQAPAPDLVAMAAGRDQLLSWGVTTAGMPSVLPNQVEAFEQMNATGNLILRTHIYLAYNSVCGERDFGDFYLSRDFSRDPDARFAIAGVKIFTDGGVCDAPATSFEYPETVPDGLKDGGWVGNGSLFVSPEEVASVVNEVDAA